MHDKSCKRLRYTKSKTLAHIKSTAILDSFVFVFDILTHQLTVIYEFQHFSDDDFAKTKKDFVVKM